MSPKRSNERGIGNLSAPQPIQEDSVDEHVSYTEFRTAFTTLTNSITAKDEWPTVVLANPVANYSVDKIFYFTQINPPLFSSFKSEEDPQQFLDQVQKVTDIIGVTSNESAKLSAYQLQDVVYMWFKKWKVDRGTDAGPIE